MPEDLEQAPEGLDQRPEGLDQRIERLLDEELRQKTEAMARELSEQLRSACAAAVSDAGAGAKKEFAENVADSARRIRAEDSVTGIATALVDGAANFCGRSLLFIHRADQLLGFRAAGRVGGEDQEAFQKLSVPVSRASAISRAIESLKASVTEGGEDEMSSEVTQLLGLSGEDRVHLFPVALRDKVLAVLACDAGAASDDAAAPVIAPAIETLVALAEAWIEAVGTRRKQSSAA